MLAATLPVPDTPPAIEPQLMRYAEDLSRLFGENQELRQVVEQFQRMLGLLLENLQGASVLLTYQDGRIHHANPAAESFFGQPPGAMVGHLLREFLRGENSGAEDEIARAARLTRDNTPHVTQLWRRDGDGATPLPVCVMRLGQVFGGPTLGWVFQSPQRQALPDGMDALLYENLPLAVMVTDLEGRIMSVNPAFTRVTGWARQDVIGQTPALLSSGRHAPPFYEALWRQLQETGRWEGEIWNRRKSGEIYPEWLVIRQARDEQGQVRGYLAMFSDLTQDKQTQEHLYRLAHQDELTGLPNRAHFLERLDALLKTERREQDGLAVLFLDLERFKEVNDTLGHEIGDRLLTAVAQRFSATVAEFTGSTGRGVVARLGGDEFAILAGGLGNAAQAETLARQLLASLETPVEVDGHLLHPGVSIGIALHPRHGRGAGDLIKHADMAMYHAKQNHLGHYLFDETLSNRWHRRQRIEEDLGECLRRNQLSLVYQPIVDAQRDQVVSIEALLRWHHPEFGLLGPQDFLPVAEEAGLMPAIGGWVLREACRQQVAWREAGLGNHRISVNLSPRQLVGSGLIGQIQALAEETGMALERLELEIIEGTLTQNWKQSINNLWQLSQLGIRLTLGDFGTGNSNLSKLLGLPIASLKMGPSLIRPLPHDDDALALVRAMVAMSRSLDLHIVAVGVETTAQRDCLLDMGHVLIQGSFFGPPLDAATMADYLARHQPASADVLPLVTARSLT